MSVFLNIVRWDPVDFPYMRLGCKHKHILSIRSYGGTQALKMWCVQLHKKLASVKKKKEKVQLSAKFATCLDNACYPKMHNPITCQSGKSPPPLGSWPLKIELLRTTRVPPNISQIEDKEIYYAKIIETHGVPFPCYVGCLAAVNTEYKRGSYLRILFSRKKSRQTLQRSITAPKSHLLAPGSNE